MAYLILFIVCMCERACLLEYIYICAYVSECICVCVCAHSCVCVYMCEGGDSRYIYGNVGSEHLNIPKVLYKPHKMATAHRSDSSRAI